MNTTIKKTLLLSALIMAVSFIPHLTSVIRSAGPEPISAGWDVDEQPGIAMRTFWNNKERASVDSDNPYHPNNQSWDGWTEPRLAGVDTFQWAIKEILVDSGVRDDIPAYSRISIYNTQTSYPRKSDGSCCITDYPPHVNFHYHWSEKSTTDPGWDADQNGHLSMEPVTRDGTEISFVYRYRFNNNNVCGENSIFNLDPDKWNARLQRDCSSLMEERYTSQGWYEMRLDDKSPVYSARSEEGVNHVNVYKDDELIFSVYRTDYVFTSSEARRVYTVKDFRRNKLITETIVSDPEDGNIIEHTIEEEPLDSEPSPTPTATPTQTPPPGPGDSPRHKLFLPQLKGSSESG